MKKFSKEINYPYTCPINNKIFNNAKSLSIYVSKTLKMETKFYYDNYLKGEIIKCHFCNNSGRFISMTKGYANLCKNDECISKSRSSYSIHGIMYNKNCDYNTATELFNKKVLNNSVVNKKRSAALSEETLRENSSRCKEFWIKKGYTEEEAIAHIKKRHKDFNIDRLDKLKNDPIYYQNYKDSCNTSIHYYINNGFTLEEAQKLLSDRQRTFSKEICIQKYGEIEGLKIWNERQTKWLKTLDDKTEEEKLEIKKKKLLNGSGYSKNSQELFWKIYNTYNTHDIVFQELSNNEYFLYNKIKKQFYKFDFVDHTNKKIIEFNGDYWHCNPKFYTEYFFNKTKQKTAKEIWDYDNIKNEYASISLGYDVLVIWENDFKQNKEKTIQLCIDFIKNR